MIKRYLEKELEEDLNYFRMVVLNGPRQAGKTTLVKEIATKKEFGYITFDDSFEQTSARKDPKRYIETRTKEPTVIDEIQKVKETIDYIKIKLDKSNLKGQLLLTGSADILRVKGLEESLAGRFSSHTLYTLSTSEKKAVKTNFVDLLFSGDFVKRVNFYNDYEDIKKEVVRGGFPESYTLPDKQRKRWFGSYLNSRVVRDFQEIHPTKKADIKEDITKILSLLATRTAQLLNYSTISKAVGLSVPTVKEYILTLESMFLIKIVKPYHKNPSKRVTKTPKLHFTDSGLASYLCGITEESIEKSDSFGNLLENYVYTEILKQTTYSKESVEIYHFRTEKKEEVDIVLESDSNRSIAIEIKKTTIVKDEDLKGLVKFAESQNESFYLGIVLYGGDKLLPLKKNGFEFWAIPIGAMWQ